MLPITSPPISGPTLLVALEQGHVRAPAVRRRPRRRRGHPHAVDPPEAPAPALRAGHVALRPRRPGRVRHPPGGRSSSATAPSGSPRSCRRRPPISCSTSSSSTCSGAPATRPASGSPSSPTTTSTRRTATSSCSPATPRCCAPRRSPRWSPPIARPRRPAPCSPPGSTTPPATAGCVRGKDDRVHRVVEEVDATDEEREIDEINTSIYCFRRSLLAPALRRLSPENAQGEYYLTDVVEVLHDAGYPVVAMVADDARETQGVNDRVQLAEAEAELRRRTNERWLRLGVTMLDPERTYIDSTVQLAPDVTLFPGTLLQGRCVDRRRRRARPRHPPGRLRRRRPVGRRAQRGPRRRGRRGRRRRSVRRARAGQPGAVRRPAPARSTLRPPRRSRPSDGPRARGIRDSDGSRHQEAPAPDVGAGQPPPGRGDRRPARRRRSATPTWPSSPTASCTAASASRSAAPTCSSSRATATPTRCRSTTRSWSS